jgi:Tat protein translocase TatB subunit
MFGIGLPEMILILALALIVVGPDKLPELARSIAKGVLELKKTVSALKEDLAEDNPFDSVKPELEDTAKSIKKQLGDMTPDGFTGAVKDLKDGLQEVIDADGTVIPVSTDDLLTSLSGATDSSAETDGEAGSEPVADSPAAGGAANRKDRGEVSESEPADDSSPAPQPAAKPEPGNQPVDSHPKNSPDPQA